MQHLLEKKCLAVIPARGGSKGIIKKNLRKLCKKSLTQRAVETCLEAGIFEDVFVSTDDKSIAAEAMKYGAQVPFYRPDALSGDRIGDIDVLYHALHDFGAYKNKQYDYVAMVQPTSPFRTAQDLQMGFSKIINEQLDSVWSVTSVDKKYHPLKLLAQSQDNGYFSVFDKAGEAIIARQQLGDIFARNGVFYFFTSEQILSKKSIYAEKFGTVVQNNFQISIDTHEDLQMARKHMARLEKQ